MRKPQLGVATSSGGKAAYALEIERPSTYWKRHHMLMLCDMLLSKLGSCFYHTYLGALFISRHKRFHLYDSAEIAYQYKQHYPYGYQYIEHNKAIT